ncbi:MAG: PorT family protein [Lentimicrobium sp.]|jgi:hypothetical protein|nr:PorT family protein [Lentimicrobium sp.]MDD2527594.1 outer membrane beta-barrel protein [Lentimicrobiaceae bacterium]MDD4597093.1 outer membrane beta-barrel protein [Lentimicrobiaceae bacterium]MDY0025094.1 outer membrane beta-barrel protein [Lentimicrobium sp.]HAH58161.1 hypothetical protein [Bacteroidales bacterium]
MRSTLNIVTKVAMNKILILSFCVLQLSTVIKSQEIPASNKLSFEFGLGYNTLSWKYVSVYENVENNRNQFSLSPSLKLKYSIPLRKFNNSASFEITPFAGYNMFGGKSKTESNGYKDIIRMQSVEIGFLPSYSLNDKFNFYGGLKGQYIFSAKNKSYGSILDPDDSKREWKTSDTGILIKDISFSAGTGFNYGIKRFFFGIEAWFGITNLSDIEGLRVYENNYRAIIGYRII